MTGEFKKDIIIFYIAKGAVVPQKKQIEWIEQWEMFECDDLFLFRDWIYPNKLSDFRGKDILECGCGGGQHTKLMAPIANEHNRSRFKYNRYRFKKK